MVKCIFCGEERDVVLHDHHIYPKFIVDRFPTDERERSETIIVCRNCHTILHDLILSPIEQKLKTYLPNSIQQGR